MFDEGQAEAAAAKGPAAGSIDSVKAFPEAREMFGRNAAATVADGDNYLFAAVGCADFNRGFDAAVLDSIVDEVDDRLFQKRRVEAGAETLITGENQFYIFLSRFGCAGLDGGMKDFAHETFFEWNFGVFGLLFNAGEGQQILDDGIQAIGVTRDDSQKALGIF